LNNLNKWSVQLAHKYEPKILKNGVWFCLTEKLNGVRGTYYRGKIYSRQGKEIEGLDHILKAIEDLNVPNMVFDGELIRNNFDNLSDNENFRIGTGIIQSNAIRKTEIKFVIFDILPNEEFEAGESKETYKQRMVKLLDLKIKQTNLKNKHEKQENLKLSKSLEILPILYEGTDQNKISELLETVTTNGKEGFILNRDTKYQTKRNFGILKIKKFNTFDLKVKSVIAGIGKYLGKMGALVVDYKGNDLHVGTGFSDEQRKEFWQDKPIGRVIEVSYFSESKNKKVGKLSLQFPAFVRMREVGKEVSCA
jgi:DNA ligase-1